MFNTAKLDFWIQLAQNVLFVGKHGVGKTSIVTQAFDRAHLKWKYFSAATMDPWVDFIGVPKEQTTPEGIAYLDLVRPLDFQLDQVEAIFFDEFNRAHKKVRNAVMELLQFKSINGRRYNNLKIIWAAINPDEDNEYDVEKLDPAQRDRFQVTVQVPYKPDLDYFTGIYGEAVARAACSWWHDLPVECKDMVPPRRLDYALNLWKHQGDMRDALPPRVSVTKLLSVIKGGPIFDRLKEIFKRKAEDEAKALMVDENSFAAAIPHLLKKPRWLHYFLPHAPAEKLSALAAKEAMVLELLVINAPAYPRYAQVVQDIMGADLNKPLAKDIRRIMGENNIVLDDATKVDPMPLLPGTAHPPRFNATTADNCLQVKGYTTVRGYMAKLEKDLLNKTGELTQTYYRNRMMGRLWMCVPKTMSTEDAVSVLKVLDAFVARSHPKTVVLMGDELVGIFNHCISILAQNESAKWSVLTGRFGAHFSNFVKKMRGTAWESKVYCP